MFDALTAGHVDSALGLVALGAALGGFVQGLSGFAFALITLPLWAWGLNDPSLTGPLVVFGSLIGQLMSIGTVRSGLQVGRIVPFVAGGVFGVPAGIFLLRYIDPAIFKIVVGLVLVVCCPALLFANRLPRIRWGGRLADAGAGVIGGAMGGLCGLTGPAPTLWTTLRGWDPDTQRAVFQVFSLSMQILTLAGYVAVGAITANSTRLFLVAMLVMPGPVLVGSRLYRRFSHAGFRNLVLGLVTASGALLIVTTTAHIIVSLSH